MWWLPDANRIDEGNRMDQFHCASQYLSVNWFLLMYRSCSCWTLLKTRYSCPTKIRPVIGGSGPSVLNYSLSMVS